MKRIIVAAALVFMTPITVFAEEVKTEQGGGMVSGTVEAKDATAGDSSISTAQKELASKLLRLAGVENELKKVSEKQLQLIFMGTKMSIMATSSSNEELAKKTKRLAALKQVFKHDLNIVDELKSLAVDAYARDYSRDELQEMISFYETPTGKKLVSKSPQLADQIIKRYMKRIGPKIKNNLQAAVDEEAAKNKSAFTGE